MTPRRTKLRVKCIQGIPFDLEKDPFLNTIVKNVIILDDLMSTMSKDPRITELYMYTEGGHYILSVRGINKSSYINRDPIQRRIIYNSSGQRANYDFSTANVSSKFTLFHTAL